MGFIIKTTHRKGGPPMYFGAVRVGRLKGSGAEAERAKWEAGGMEVADFEIAKFDTLVEASPWVGNAAAALGSFPPTRNLDYEIVEA